MAGTNTDLEKMVARHLWYPKLPAPSHPVPTERTASRCGVDACHGAHVFEVTNFSLHRGLGVGRFIRSATFAVGGYAWSICFYPDGYDEDSHDHVSVELELLTADAKVRASYSMGLVDHATGVPWFAGGSCPGAFSTTGDEGFSRCVCRKFELRSELEASQYLRRDRVDIECVVTVIRETRVSEARPVGDLLVPPSDLPEHLGRMLEEGEGADVTFDVKGETFPAHRMVLAMRSSVFKAELCGPMMERELGRITIRDMQPAVFRALLHFIYTDSLPAMPDLDKEDNREMTRHLLIAADRYDVERLKLMCEQILARSLGIDNVPTTLALADWHNCGGLKDACIDYIIASERMDDVVRTKGYARLKRARPSVLVEVLEKAGKLRLI